MRFDDTLETVLAGDFSTPSGVQSAWRQLVDLIGRRRVVPDTRALSLLRRIRPDVPPPVRAASARGLEFADPPPPLVRLFALDEIAIAVPVLRHARMSSGDWIQLLPDLAPAARAILRHRRDLSPVVRRALDAYGPIDFVLSDETRRDEPAELIAEAPAVEEVTTEPMVAESGYGLAVLEREPIVVVERQPDEWIEEVAVDAVTEQHEVIEPIQEQPEQVVDWTEVLASLAHSNVSSLVASEPTEAPETVADEQIIANPAVLPNEDLSFVALVGIAAALPNETIISQPESEVSESQDQSGTDGATDAADAIAEPLPAAQGPDMAAETLFPDEIVEALDSMPETLGEPTSETDGPFQIAEVVARIDAFWRDREQGDRDAPLRAATPSEHFRFETDAKGVIRWVDGVSRAPIVGLSLDSQSPTSAADGPRVDGIAAGAFRRRAGFSNARMALEGDSDAAGAWLISAIPVFDPANGRFTGYRGTARRPRADERAEPVRPHMTAPDSLRQLVHELRTPTNAIAGFAEMIETQILGPVSDPYRDRAQIIRAQAKELLGAIDDLDLAARIESAALALVPGRVALRPVLASIADDLAQLAELRSSYIALPVDDLAVTGDRRAVERLLARLMATLVSASSEGERVGVRTALESDDKVAITIDRPKALADYPGESMLGIDDEAGDATLLGTGFALRLARNLARELGGSLVIEAESLTLRLPASVSNQVGQAHLS